MTYKHSWRQRQQRIASVQGYLAQVAELTRGNASARLEGWKYHSVEELVLDLGRPFKLGGLPPECEQGEPKLCFMNATQMALYGPYTYCEGFASAGFPTLHAWGTNDGRTAFDPTWKNDGTDYFGIPFATDFVRKQMVGTGYYGILGGATNDLADLLRDGVPSGAVARI